MNKWVIGPNENLLSTYIGFPPCMVLRQTLFYPHAGTMAHPLMRTVGYLEVPSGSRYIPSLLTLETLPTPTVLTLGG
jgi:hypothetical protein